MAIKNSKKRERKISVGRLVLPLVGAALIGCVTTSGPPQSSYTVLNTPPREMYSRSTQSVELYRLKRPTKSFVEVGILSGSGHNDGAAIQRMRMEAARVGCDAIVIGELADATAHHTSYTNMIIGTGDRPDHSTSNVSTARGTCIVYQGAPGTAPVAPPVAGDDCQSQRTAAMREPNLDRRLRMIRAMPTDCHRG